MARQTQEEVMIAKEMRSKQAKLLADRAGISIVTNLVTAVMLGLSCLSQAGLAAVVTWLGVMAVVVGLRLAQVRSFRRNTNRHTAEKWLDLFQYSAFATGTAWSLGIIWFGWLVGGVELAIIGFLVAGMTSGSAVFAAAYRPMAVAYGGPMIAALVFVLIYKGGLAHFLLVGAIVLYCLALLLILNRAAYDFEQSSKRSLENEKLAHRLSLALAREESAHAAQTQLVANVSHELRTPLGAVIGMIDLARVSADQDNREQFLGIARESADALRVMLDDLLEVSKLDLGHLELKSEAMDPSVLVQSVGDLFRLKAQDAGLAFHVETEWPDNLVIQGDNNRVRQILVNLVGNALKFTVAGSVSIHLSPKVDETGAVTAAIFTVADTGIGIPKNEQRRVFERFEQVDGASNRSHQGAGLGLAISRELARAMGGDIKLSSEPGDGSCFTFDLPCRQVDLETGHDLIAENMSELKDAEARDERYQKAFDRASDSGVSVLVVDDNEINCVLITAILAQAGIHFDVANSGQEAIDAVKNVDNRRFDAVLMDVQMPGMDGIEATQVIRSLDAGVSQIPVIAVTANAFKEQRLKCLEAGMQGFVVKPIEADFMIDEIMRVVNEARSGAGASPLLTGIPANS